jgi:heme-degrading monooxygenase HmoA
MVHTIVRHKVADYSKWKQAFDSFLNHRLAGGETGSRVFQSVDDPREVTVITDWENAEHARRFMASDDLRTAMKNAGVQGDPDISFVQDAVLIRRSSAD